MAYTPGTTFILSGIVSGQPAVFISPVIVVTLGKNVELPALTISDGDCLARGQIVVTRAKVVAVPSQLQGSPFIFIGMVIVCGTAKQVYVYTMPKVKGDNTTIMYAGLYQRRVFMVTLRAKIKSVWHTASKELYV